MAPALAGSPAATADAQHSLFRAHSALLPAAARLPLQRRPRKARQDVHGCTPPASPYPSLQAMRLLQATTCMIIHGLAPCQHLPLLRAQLQAAPGLRQPSARPALHTSPTLAYHTLPRKVGLPALFPITFSVPARLRLSQAQQPRRCSPASKQRAAPTRPITSEHRFRRTAPALTRPARARAAGCISERLRGKWGRGVMAGTLSAYTGTNWAQARWPRLVCTGGQPCFPALRRSLAGQRLPRRRSRM